MIHEFDKSLAFSHRCDEWPGWESVYRTAFPTMRAMVNLRPDGPAQRAGIDRSITLATSKQILVDEKCRGCGADGRIYNDILLEVWSDEQRRKPGWVQKQLLCDYIAYLNRPAGWCYLLPVIQLQSAWAHYGESWSKRYPPVRAPNPGFVTLSCPVPVEVLFPAIGSCLRVRVEEPVEEDIPF